MSRLRKPQWLALGLAVVVIVLLVLVPRTPPGKREELAKQRTDPQAVKLAEAVALVNGQEPMRGIQMLREIVEEDPQNTEAHWQLGLFSIQSGQYAKALDRFRKVVEQRPDDYPDAWFFLGRTYATLDSTEQALASLRKYRTMTQDTAILRGVDRFIDELENEKR